MRVTALLVSHDGARWLPAVLAGLADQRHQPDRVLAVDTGSSDDSAALIASALGPERVLRHDGAFPDAVRAALEHIDTEWVWILHDDANPDPGCLGALLAAADQHGAAIAGPKLREWPSLKRLLELGVTISATGRRETGLERGEYDQGQHDTVREVLAVNTAGMLVRRDVLADHGFDPQLPLFGNDIDFGWRAARAGHKTVVVPDAVLFHAEAAHRGLRRTSILGRRTRTHRAEREAALYTLLANTDSRRLPWQAVRLVVGTLLRFVGYLLARSPGHAGDEIAALLNTLRRGGRIRAARRERRDLHGAEPTDVRRLLAPWWLPYRHGLDYVSDIATAAANQGRDAAERRRAKRLAASGQPLAPGPEEADELAADSGLLARFFTSPVALSLTAFLLVCLWGAREAIGPLSGGALSPAPEADNDWWRLITEGWHELGQGTDAPAPEYLLFLATAASLLFGKPAIVVSLLFLVAVPFAAWGAYRFLAVIAELGSGRDHSRLLVAWGALTYAAVPVASGAWGQGRFGILVSAALLPWLAHAALGLFESSSERRWRATWRSAMLLAIMTAFTPSAWIFALLLIGVLAGLLQRFAPEVLRSRDTWLPMVVVVGVPPLLLLPGTIGVIGHDLTAVFLEAGRLSAVPSGLDLLAGRLGDPAAPTWLGLLLLVPGVGALLRARSRPAILLAWGLVALAALLALVLSRLTVTLPAGEARPGLGFCLVVGQFALLTAVVVAGQGLWSQLRPARLGWEQPVAGLLAAAAVVSTVGGLGWWLFDGKDLLHRPYESDVPAYMSQAAETGTGHGALLVRGAVDTGLTWEVYRGDGMTLGEDEILALTGPDHSMSKDVSALLSSPTPQTAEDMQAHGIDYVVLPAPADPQVSATLDAASGIVQASAAERSTRAWQFEKRAPGDAVSGDRAWWLPILLVLQFAGFVVVAVLCGPTRREDA